MTCKLFTIVLLVVLPLQTVTAQFCASIAGQWTDNFEYDYSLSQSPSGSVTGTLDATSDPVCPGIYNVTGSRQGSTPTFQLSMQRTAPIEFPCAQQFTETVTLNTPGCDTGSGTWLSLGVTGDLSVSKDCDVPSGETTSPQGWDSTPGRQTIHNWLITLQPSSKNFGGRIVYESGSGGTDTCFHPSVGIPPQTSLPPGADSWSIDESNRSTTSDGVGWFPAAVQTYRAAGRAPCGFTIPQTMTIRCNLNGDRSYETHPVGAGIQATTVSSSRDGQSAQRAWP